MSRSPHARGKAAPQRRGKYLKLSEAEAVAKRAQQSALVASSFLEDRGCEKHCAEEGECFEISPRPWLGVESYVLFVLFTSYLLGFLLVTCNEVVRACSVC